MKHFLWVFTLLLLSDSLLAQAPSGYQMPPKAIADLANAPLPPALRINSSREWMMLIERPGYPSIEELAQPELRLAGLRMNPRTNGSSRSYSYSSLTLKHMDSGRTFSVSGLPGNSQIENLSWSPNGKRFAFTITTQKGIALWAGTVAGKSASPLTDSNVNDAMGGTPYDWIGSDQILVKMVPKDRGDRPEEILVPAGPVIQESAGQKTTLRTYQDLLENPYDEELFEYYTTSELVMHDLEKGTSKPFAKAGMIAGASPSPDDQYIMVETIHRPFSYLVPYYRFPTTTEVYDLDGNLVKLIDEQPLIEQLPKGFGAVQEGKRRISWRDDQPATLYWVEAQDGGDPQREVDVRDKLFYWSAPFKDGEVKAGLDFELRFSGIVWGNASTAIAYEYWWATRNIKTSLFTPGKPDSKKVLFDRSYQDRYSDPGSFETTYNEFGEQVLLMADGGRTLFLTGQGASPEGNRPFVRTFDLKTQETRELWRSEAPYYESPAFILDAKKGMLVTRRESPDDPPNYYIRNWKTGDLDAITDFPHPYPALAGIEKEVVQYQRKDGLDLQGDLYLPKGYNPETDGPLPVIMWAYPREFKSKGDAGQVQGSPYEFVRLYWGSPLYWLTQGYAVFDQVAMPIVGEEDEEPNDYFREQLVGNAEAAIDVLAERGIADRNRIAVGGHSYGAFMTANLLAHSDLFAAGIARSGAYNRTLTPFGFQSEERTYWDAPEVYYTMSPFMHADKVNEPLLMIHGEADNNSGTFPLQSERMYQAINGLGGKARLVMLPHESHGYRAKESIMHMLYEQDAWLEKYVKNRKVKP
ncbi:MAG: alpha/beta hydrolase family protein [Phaeodactylibacter xiamenensis]|uniref:Aminoacyl peptidase n=1 Tax=Phaeodactylibacter xiamenensis TaxID=1524460 RepID=A0A098S0V5_9BACT|nr:prolyl oligopeptidase family serine peptidase [Phaeodactylibacter xiamenensis]KGE85984.1 aminoacyl peptidase [Phaeodactylibacter xiamenensis]MCR9055022.1 prolyl oligopeptidase family serine peptidase [bacterium]